MTDKRPTGRPSTYRPEYCDQVIEHCTDGASLTSFAAEIDVARSTINEWMDKHPDFSEAVKRAKAKCAAWWERQARSGASGAAKDINPTLCIFGLKNMAADDWRDKIETEHTGKDGGPIQFEDMTRLSDEELHRRASEG